MLNVIEAHLYDLVNAIWLTTMLMNIMANISGGTALQFYQVLACKVFSSHEAQILKT